MKILNVLSIFFIFLVYFGIREYKRKRICKQMKKFWSIKTLESKINKKTFGKKEYIRLGCCHIIYEVIRCVWTKVLGQGSRTLFLTPNRNSYNKFTNGTDIPTLPKVLVLLIISVSKGIKSIGWNSKKVLSALGRGNCCPQTNITEIASGNEAADIALIFDYWWYYDDIIHQTLDQLFIFFLSS